MIFLWNWNITKYLENRKKEPEQKWSARVEIDIIDMKPEWLIAQHFFIFMWNRNIMKNMGKKQIHIF